MGASRPPCMGRGPGEKGLMWVQHRGPPNSSLHGTEHRPPAQGQRGTPLKQDFQSAHSPLLGVGRPHEVSLPTPLPAASSHPPHLGDQVLYPAPHGARQDVDLAVPAVGAVLPHAADDATDKAADGVDARKVRLGQALDDAEGALLPQSCMEVRGGLVEHQGKTEGPSNREGRRGRGGERCMAWFGAPQSMPWSTDCHPIR